MRSTKSPDAASASIRRSVVEKTSSASVSRHARVSSRRRIRATRTSRCATMRPAISVRRSLFEERVATSGLSIGVRRVERHRHSFADRMQAPLGTDARLPLAKWRNGRTADGADWSPMYRAFRYWGFTHWGFAHWGFMHWRFRECTRRRTQASQDRCRERTRLVLGRGRSRCRSRSAGSDHS